MMYGKTVAATASAAKNNIQFCMTLLRASNASIMARIMWRRTASETATYCASVIAPGTFECERSETYFDKSAKEAFSMVPDSTAEMISFTCCDEAIGQSVGCVEFRTLPQEVCVYWSRATAWRFGGARTGLVGVCDA
jgi:hypothetical protein